MVGVPDLLRVCVYAKIVVGTDIHDQLTSPQKSHRVLVESAMFITMGYGNEQTLTERLFKQVQSRKHPVRIRNAREYAKPRWQVL